MRGGTLENRQGYQEINQRNVLKARGWHVQMLKNNLFHKQDYFITIDMNSDLAGEEGCHLAGEESMSKTLKECGVPRTIQIQMQ